MHTLLATLAGAVLVAGCGSGQPASGTGDPHSTGATAERVDREVARLNGWLEARFEEQLDFSPLQKTMIGRKDDYDKIDDLSERAEDAQLTWRRQTVRDLEQSFDYALLTPDAKISYDLWRYQLEQAEAARPFRRRGYLFHQMQGPHTSLPRVLINFHRVDQDADMVAYIARIGEVGRAMAQGLDQARLAAAEGVRAPRFAYEGVLEQARALLRGAPFGGDGDAPLWADAKQKIDALAADGRIEAARAGALRKAAETALRERFKPAYDALIAWAASDLAHADEIATGVWKLPDGPAFYAERLAASTTTNMTADQIHAIGLSEVARIHTEMEALKKQVGFDGPLRAFFTFVRNNPKFYFSNTDEGRAAYLQSARDYIGFIKALLPEYFGLVPKADLLVKRVEAFREQPGAAQHYSRGTPDGSRPGTFYAHLMDMNAMPKWDLESVAYHEGIPGHHMQIAIAQERQGLPTFRTQIGFTAYVEGWGLYAERLAKEMGAYQDPYSDFGRLGAEIWRAIRLVVDTGLHAKGWTEQQAVDYFLANAPTSEGQIRAEIRRYLVMPGQATAYKVGMLKIQELRARAESALGGDFDIRAFHDTVLGGGALPLSILERRIDAWIEERGSVQATRRRSASDGGRPDDRAPADETRAVGTRSRAPL